MDYNYNIFLGYDYSNRKRRCTSVTGHFDGHADALEKYGVHHPIQHDQGFAGSHWTPPSGDYYPGSRQGDNQQNNNAKCTHVAGRFDGHRNVAV
jgi:hypothetical protein